MATSQCATPAHSHFLRSLLSGHSRSRFSRSNVCIPAPGQSHFFEMAPVIQTSDKEAREWMASRVME